MEEALYVVQYGDGSPTMSSVVVLETLRLFGGDSMC